MPVSAILAVHGDHAQYGERYSGKLYRWAMHIPLGFFPEDLMMIPAVVCLTKVQSNHADECNTVEQTRYYNNCHVQCMKNRGTAVQLLTSHGPRLTCNMVYNNQIHNVTNALLQSKW